MSLSSWDEFCTLLLSLSKKEGHKGGPNSSPLISPSIFPEGKTRANRHVSHWGGWCAVDVDDHNFSTDLTELKAELHKRFGRYDYVVYSTASSKPTHLKFRIVFRTDVAIQFDRIRKFWFALNTELGEIGDPQTKDESRMYYVPAAYVGAYSFFFRNDGGEALDTSKLIAAHPYSEKQGTTFLERLPSELQKEVIAHRRSKLNNTQYRWSSYRDCPFITKQQVNEYKSITGTGWYRASYSIMLSIASNAVRRGYPITANEIATLCREMDADNPETKERYINRQYEKEADGAIEYVYTKGKI